MQKTVHCIHLNNLCPCFCAGILLSRSFDARDALEQTLFSKKTNRLFIKHFQFFARDFLHRGSPKPVTAAQASIALDYCNTEAKMYQSAQKTTRCQRAHKGFGTQNTPNATAFCSSRSPMPFLNPNPLSQRLRTQPASRREGTQLSRKVNEMPPSFLKLNSPFRTPFRTFFRFRI